MTSVLLELFRHKTWATLQLIEFCQTLSPDHLEASAPGTYGSVRATLIHLANGESNYYNGLLDKPFGPPLGSDASLDMVAERIQALGPDWETICQDPSQPDREIHNRYGVTLGVAVIAQAIHHADDHRSQVLSILGGRGLEVPELDVWGYSRFAGLSRASAE
jgi:uncharacterized damage-inducible protein DinB